MSNVKLQPLCLSKIKFINYSAEVAMLVRIKKGVNIPKVVQHEKVHVAIYSSWARKLDNYMKPYMDVCMCRDYAKAVDELLRAINIYYLDYAIYESKSFDCAVYTDPYEKGEVCKLRDKALKDANKDYKEKVLPALEKVRACNK